MKRTFLHALGICFVVGFFAGIILLVTGNQIAGILVGLICMLMSALLLRAAERAPIRRSKALRLTGWLAGFGIALALIAVIIVL